MDPHEIALWRYEQIEDLLEESLTRSQRRRRLRRRARTPVHWPDGDERPVSEATLYRWLRRYSAERLEGLEPSSPPPRAEPQAHAQLTKKHLDYVISLLREEPERSLTILGEFLRVEKKVEVARSTLHRHLQRHPDYGKLRREQKKSPALKRRFEAKRPHEIWQCDSKGPFPVRFEGNKEPVKIHVFTILDDHSRAVLQARAFEHAGLAAAVSVFRTAARRWGLPKRYYADRASIFDSKAFRGGLALLGAHRIRTRPRNAAARGKVEAYHRVLKGWFIRELRHQIVHDLDHLNRLLTAVLQSIYMQRRHRSIRKPPREALAEVISDRQVSSDRLTEAFLVRRRKKAHPKTGEVELGPGLFKVSEELAGKRHTFFYDPVDPEIAFVRTPEGSRERVRPAIDPSPPRPAEEKWGEGRLQAIYDNWKGGARPLAEAGFGLPEIFLLFEERLSRRVPQDESEARLIQEFYREKGPFARAATERALRKVFSGLGSGRPLATYLQALCTLIVPRGS